MPDGVKALLDVILQTIEFFRKYFCFRQRKANAFFFSIVFLGLLKDSHQFWPGVGKI